MGDRTPWYLLVGVNNKKCVLLTDILIFLLWCIPVYLYTAKQTCKYSYLFLGVVSVAVFNELLLNVGCKVAEPTSSTFVEVFDVVIHPLLWLG